MDGPADPMMDLGEGWATYVWGARRRPFVHPLRTPAGHVLTIDRPADHPWHHGLWFTIKYVNGDNFWEEQPPYGVLRHRDRPALDENGWWRGAVDWIGPERTTVIEERRAWRLQPISDRRYALDLDATLVPVVDVELDRTPYTTWGGYGGLTLRGRPDWHDTAFVLDDGTGRDLVRGERSAWCSLTGSLGTTDVRAGVAILDHPANPNHPVPWYASTRADTYGDAGWSNFCNAAFLWDGSRSVPAREELRFQYRILVVDGDIDVDEIDAQHRQWSSS